MKRRDDRISGPKPLASSAARRVEAIVEGAERAAERVIDEAEASARAYLAEAEASADRAVSERLAALGELSDDLVAQAEAIRRQSELLARALRAAKQRLQGEAGGEPSLATDPGAEPRAPRLAAVAPGEAAALDGSAESDRAAPDGSAAPDRASERAGRAGLGGPADRGEQDPAPVDEIAERRGRGSPAGARLLATQMAVSGSSREEIAARLRTGFEIEDAGAILDAILGPEAS